MLLNLGSEKRAAVPAWIAGHAAPVGLSTSDGVPRALEDVARSERSPRPAFALRYAVGPLLSRGAISEVYRAERICAEGVRIPVAIKRITVPHLDARLSKEARILAGLDHGNIVRWIDFVPDDRERLALILELVHGLPLERVVRAGPLPPPVAVSIAMCVLAALDLAHGTKAGIGAVSHATPIVHRRVTADHVLLSWAGAVKLAGFGHATARAATHDEVPGMQAGDRSGVTTCLVADHRGDLRAVGALLWGMLTGQVTPSSVHPASAASLLTQLRPTGAPLLPDELGLVLGRLLDPDPAVTYASAGEAEAALQNCLARPVAGCDVLPGLLRERFAAEAPGRVRRVHVASPARGPRRTRTSTLAHDDAVKRRRRRRACFGVIGLVLAAVALGIVLGWLSRAHMPPRRCRVTPANMSLRGVARATSSKTRHMRASRVASDPPRPAAARTELAVLSRPNHPGYGASRG